MIAEVTLKEGETEWTFVLNTEDMVAYPDVHSQGGETYRLRTEDVPKYVEVELAHWGFEIVSG